MATFYKVNNSNSTQRRSKPERNDSPIFNPYITNKSNGNATYPIKIIYNSASPMN